MGQVCNKQSNDLSIVDVRFLLKTKNRKITNFRSRAFPIDSTTDHIFKQTLKSINSDALDHQIKEFTIKVIINIDNNLRKSKIITRTYHTISNEISPKEKRIDTSIASIQTNNTGKIFIVPEQSHKTKKLLSYHSDQSMIFETDNFQNVNTFNFHSKTQVVNKINVSPKNKNITKHHHQSKSREIENKYDIKNLGSIDFIIKTPFILIIDFLNELFYNEMTSYFNLSYSSVKINDELGYYYYIDNLMNISVSEDTIQVIVQNISKNSTKPSSNLSRTNDSNLGELKEADISDLDCDLKIWNLYINSQLIDFSFSVENNRLIFNKDSVEFKFESIYCKN